MRCPACRSTAIRERPERTAQGYRRFRCRCGKQFNERSAGVLNKAQYPSDVIALGVFWRLRYKLSLRDLAEMFLTRGFIFTYEAVREWEAKLTPALAENLRRKRKGRIGLRQTAMTPIPGRSGQSSAGRCDIGRVAISTTDLSRTIAASKADVDRCWD
jgi:transposase-like protein